MLNTQTMDKLRELKLTVMIRALEEQTSSAGYDDLGFEERLGLLAVLKRSHHFFDLRA